VEGPGVDEARFAWELSRMTEDERRAAIARAIRFDASRWGAVGQKTAKLFEAAPDMARVLLAIEWGDEADSYPMCPSCLEIRGELGHADDCALEAALRKAGVR
jgi:hypothetical protein